MTKCPWTGQEFKAVTRGANEKVFATDQARAEAHKAARLFTEHLIESGFMSWASLRRWYDAQKNPARSPYTTKRRRSGRQEHLPFD